MVFGYYLFSASTLPKGEVGGEDPSSVPSCPAPCASSPTDNLAIDQQVSSYLFFLCILMHFLPDGSTPMYTTCSQDVRPLYPVKLNI